MTRTSQWRGRPLAGRAIAASLLFCVVTVGHAHGDSVTVSVGGSSATVDSPVPLGSRSLPPGCTPDSTACVATTSTSTGSPSSSSSSPSVSTSDSTAIGATLASGGTSQPAPAPAVGANFHGMWSDYTDEQRLAVLDKLAAAGIRWIRLDIGWASLEERCKECLSQWVVDRADFLVNAARERGISVLGLLWTTPGWANGGAGAYAPPTDPAEYGRIAKWAASHFRGRVAAWEVWNEPNQPYFFVGGTAASYAALLRAAYPQFKAGDPDALVVLGGPAYNDSGWLKAVYAAGAAGSFDVMATHPYLSPSNLAPETPDPTGTNIWTISHIAAVRSLMAAHGDGSKPVWFTEFGWSDHENALGTAAWELGVTAEQQGDYFVRTIEYLKATFPYVTHIFWYTDRNDVTGNAQLDNYGLLNRDLTPKPVYLRIQAHLLASPPESADLAVTLSDAPDPVTAGSNVAHTAVVTNRGPGRASDVLVTFTRAVPDATILVSADAPTGTCSITTVAACLIPALGAGASVTATIVQTPIAPSTLNPSVAVTAATPDPAVLNNTASQPTAVTAAAATTYVTVSDAGFAPAAVTIAQGDTVTWTFPGPAAPHSVTDRSKMALFDSGLRAPVTTYSVRFLGAGLYRYRDSASGKRGSVTVPGKIAPLAGSTATTFVVTWAAAAAPAGFAYDVQIARPGARWANWRRGQTTTLSANFVPDAGTGTYKFRMRYRRVATGAATAWVQRAITVR